MFLPKLSGRYVSLVSWMGLGDRPRSLDRFYTPFPRRFLGGSATRPRYSGLKAFP